VKNGVATVKDMDAGSQETVALTDLIARLKQS